MKTLVAKVHRPARESDGIVTAFRDGEVTLRTNRRSEGFTMAEKEIGYQGVRVGDLVVHSMDGFAGSIGVSDSDGKASPVVHCYLTTERADARFLAYLLRHLAGTGYISTLAKGIRERSTSFDSATLLDLTISAPGRDEQARVADYLDNAIAQIRTLEAARRRQLKLVQERFDAEWFAIYASLMHAHPTLPLRRVIASIVDGPFGSALTSAHYSDTGARVLRLGNIGLNDFRLEDAAFIPEAYAKELAGHAVVPGDVVIAGLGDDNMPLGRAAVVPEKFGSGVVKADCYRVRPGQAVSAEYLAWALSSPQSRAAFKLLSRGSTRSRLNTEVAKSAPVVVPPLEGQQNAVSQSNGFRHGSRLVQSRLIRSIELLVERRQSLIAAAVTGQLDVTTASRKVA